MLDSYKILTVYLKFLEVIMQTVLRFLAIYCLDKRSYMDYSRKNLNRRGWGHNFWKKTPGIFRFVTLPLEVLGKMKLTPGNSTKLCYTYWNFQGQKPRPMEIPHDFFWITPVNSTSFCIDPRNFHILFIQYSWKFHVFNLLVCIFFWNSPTPIPNVFLKLNLAR